MNMKRRNVLYFCVGLSLSAPGCGATNNPSEQEMLGTAAQALTAMERLAPQNKTQSISPVELPPPGGGEGGGGGDGGGGSGPTCPSSGGGMSAAEYIEHAINVPPGFRCRSITENECQNKLNRALSMNLVTCGAYQWGWNNGYWPAISEDGVIDAVCKCGCFESSTLILAQGVFGDVSWTPAEQIKTSDNLASLDESSTLREPRLQAKAIKAFTRGEETPLLHVFSLDNGHQLKVTQNHGMLLSDGRVVPAKKLSSGARFVGVDGRIVNVTAVTYEQTKKDVYNFEVATETKAGHIIAAEGVLVGDLAWQNQLAHEASAINVRRD